MLAVAHLCADSVIDRPAWSQKTADPCKHDTSLTASVILVCLISYLSDEDATAHIVS